MSDIKDILVEIDIFVINHPEIRGHRDFGSLLRDLGIEIKKLTSELARRDASLLTEGEQKEILSYIQGNYDRDKIPTWLLDLIDGITSRNEIIKRLKEDGERLAKSIEPAWSEYFKSFWCIKCDCAITGMGEGHKENCPIFLHRALMKELN